MNHKWEKLNSCSFAYFVNNQKIGEINQDPSSPYSKAIFTLENKNYFIQKTSIWKTNLEITNEQNQVILKAYPKNWYANSFTIEFENQNYQLLLRNNPMAEWAIVKDNNDILAYGVVIENKQLQVKISSSTENQNPIFHALLWFVFQPVLAENSSDDLLFLMMLGS